MTDGTERIDPTPDDLEVYRGESRLSSIKEYFEQQQGDDDE